jgi:CheY-like chemotaxis protein
VGDANAAGTRLLVVDDEETVRAVLVRALADEGFAVDAAEDGAAALVQLEQRGGNVALMVTDLVMPGMSGRELGRMAARRWPHLRLLFVSGYSEEYLHSHALLDARVPLLRKPFLPSRLREAVQDALGQPPHGELLARAAK